MKTVTLILVLVLAFASASTNAQTIETRFFATAPTQYDDDTDIGLDDSLEYSLFCGETSGMYWMMWDISPLLVNGGTDVDVASCVTQPGTYYFVATAFSSLKQTRSDYSNETTKTYTEQDFIDSNIPTAPVLISVGP